MVRSIEHYANETIVVVIAKVRKAPKRVKNATIHDQELEVYEVHKVSDLTENVPFTVYDAENINRDKEEADDDEEDGSLSSFFPSTNDTPKKGTPRDSPPKGGTPRASTDLSRLSVDNKNRISTDRFADKLTSRSKSRSPEMRFMLTSA